MPYQITQTIEHPTKYVYMVSFNGNPAERYEIELSDEDPKVLAEKIDAILTEADTEVAARPAKEQAKEAAKAEVVVEAGKINL